MTAQILAALSALSAFLAANPVAAKLCTMTEAAIIQLAIAILERAKPTAPPVLDPNQMYIVQGFTPAGAYWWSFPSLPNNQGSNVHEFAIAMAERTKPVADWKIASVKVFLHPGPLFSTETL